jgi:2-oxoglutarate ferredoxin oxidoreductase subunit beta
VEILTMCPTGWFIETGEAPQYLDEHIEPTHRFGVIKSPPSAR